MGDPGASTNLVEQFHEHVWVTPFTDDDVYALLELVPVERVLFGSDYPHAEGFAEPKQFFGLLEGISAGDQRRIMRDNARGTDAQVTQRQGVRKNAATSAANTRLLPRSEVAAAGLGREGTPSKTRFDRGAPCIACAFAGEVGHTGGHLDAPVCCAPRGPPIRLSQ